MDHERYKQDDKRIRDKTEIVQRLALTLMHVSTEKRGSNRLYLEHKIFIITGYDLLL